jgi:NIPSNAP
MLRPLILAICAFAMTLQADDKVFELRTYTSTDGKLDNLVARFRDHTLKLFEKHGMQNIGYWISTDKPNTLIYIVAHKSSDAAKASWDAFRKDPVWIKARDASEAEGKIVAKVESVFMKSVDFSKIK